ncbi:3-keto-5-aminohexanoate cleavage protein [Oceanicola sp. 22II-s10i]|uniref:3-keto-5-aminohexanoate cleavage protein n=1 Tax=Oceanicola sp. 22II-s10i TaxID=1317116 RepID=UPI0020CBF1B5|nr:3-keto-5-aminohexanoate cleavage protein [Oceanicola sp. 22II-s10i]
MLAPNGGRRLPAEHAAIPVTIAQSTACAVAGAAAGADAIHVHLRDAEGGHLLDAGGYGELIAEIGRAAPGMAVQITTEAIGRYGPAEQMQVVRDTKPDFASCALRELCADEGAALRFYAEMAEAGVGIQHILYTADDIRRYRGMVEGGHLARDGAVIFVVGTYPDGGGALPRQLADYVALLGDAAAEWMVCAFGAGESRVLAAAMAMGGHARVGFENSLQMADGSVAADNAARVREVADLRRALGLTGGGAARALGAR